MALEQLQSTGQSEVSDDDIIACYECAGDIVLWLTTDQISTTRPSGTSQAMPLGRTLEIAIQRSPVLLIKNGWEKIFKCNAISCFYNNWANSHALITTKKMNGDFAQTRRNHWVDLSTHLQAHLGTKLASPKFLLVWTSLLPIFSLSLLEENLVLCPHWSL